MTDNKIGQLLTQACAPSDVSAEEREAIFKRLGELAPWHHDHEILPGIRTGSFNRASYAAPHKKNVKLIEPSLLERFFRRVSPAGLAGKSVLDVACNSGGYCFLAHTLGAKRVLGVDVRQHWLDQAEFVRAIKYPSSAAVEFKRMDIAEYLASSDEQFDITLFKGIFYHLPDPISVLCRVSERTRETILVNTACTDSIPEACLTPIRESTTPAMSGVDGLAWIPGGPAAITPILESKGFKYSEVSSWTHPPNGMGRFALIGSRIPIRNDGRGQVSSETA